MKTYVGILVLIFVAAALGGILYYLSENVEPKVVDEEAAVYDTLDLSAKCDIESDSDWNACCKDNCGPFCDKYDQKSVKYFANLHLCTCWCE